MNFHLAGAGLAAVAVGLCILRYFRDEKLIISK